MSGLQKSVNGESTAFTVVNTQSSAQTYTITFYNQNGNAVNTVSVYLAGNSSWTYYPSNDRALPAGFNGSAEVSTTGGGLSPVVLASLYAGNFQPPYVSSGNGTCPDTATPTPLVSNTPTPTPVQSYTPTMTPTVTSTRIPPPLLGASSYVGGNNQSTQFVLPLVRSDNGYNTIVHLANANSGPASVQVTFYNADGSLNSDLTRQVQFPTWGLFDFDVLGQHPNFNGSAIVTGV